MRPFEYASPKTMKEALALLGTSWDDSAVLAGGTDLISLMKDGVMAPKRVVNIKDIAELRGISSAGSVLRIGAATTVDELAENATVRRSLPVLHQAARGITSSQIRNMGTVGGDLCQRPRCWYFRAGFGLLAQKDGQSLVEHGENKYHAIFGSGPARFVSASSFGPALVALNAKVKLVSASGSREVEAGKFFLSPTSGEAREVDLKPNEILTEILIPGGNMRSATYEVRQKEALDWPLATASVVLGVKGTAISSVKVVLGHVAPAPWDVSQAAQSLVGKPVSISEDAAEGVGSSAVSGARPLSGNRYKVQLAKVAVKRALLAASGQTPVMRGGAKA
ncbi:MAG: xanthine dehydrogenase family protein subunit M [Bryobacterales bacterium]|nr:xanthine dehydrogenase family protein subunit M [Bryobacterales bacterium]